MELTSELKSPLTQNRGRFIFFVQIANELEKEGKGKGIGRCVDYLEEVEHAPTRR
jgi:hypothetical protein